MIISACYDRHEAPQLSARPISFRRASAWLDTHGFSLCAYCGSFVTYYSRPDGAQASACFEPIKTARGERAGELFSLLLEEVPELTADASKPWGGLF